MANTPEPDTVFSCNQRVVDRDHIVADGDEGCLFSSSYGWLITVSNHKSALQHTADIHIHVQSEGFDLSDEMLQLQNCF